MDSVVVVVDGVRLSAGEWDRRGLRPDDLAFVEILKGPEASRLYGEAGARGAVLITTTSGRR